VNAFTANGDNSNMKTHRPDWERLMTEERDMLLLGTFVLERNAKMTAQMAVSRIVRGVSRGGLVIYCDRAKIPLPNTGHGRRYYARLRRLTAEGHGRLSSLRNRFGNRFPVR